MVFASQKYAGVRNANARKVQGEIYDQIAVVGAVHDHRVDEDGKQNGNDAQKEERDVADARLFAFADAARKEQIEQVIGEIVDDEGKDVSEHRIDGNWNR